MVRAERSLEGALLTTHCVYLRQRHVEKQLDANINGDGGGGGVDIAIHLGCKSRCYQASLRRHRRRVQRLQRRVNHLNSKAVAGTGAVFVSFTTVRGAQRFLREFRSASHGERVARFYLPPHGIERRLFDHSTSAQPSRLSQHDGKAGYEHEGHTQLLFLARGKAEWQVSHAPTPTDILWENTFNSHVSRRKRQAATALVMVLVGALMTGLVLLIVLGLGMIFIEYRFELHPAPGTIREDMLEWLDRTRSRLGIAGHLCILSPPLLLLMVKGLSAMLLRALTYWEHHFTGSHREESYLVKSFIVFLFLNVILPTLAYGLLAHWANVGDANTIFVEFATSSVVNVMLLEALIYNPIRLIAGLKVYRYRKWRQMRSIAFSVRGETNQEPTTPTTTASQPDDNLGSPCESMSRKDDAPSPAGSPRLSPQSATELPAELDMHAPKEWDVMQAPEPFDMSKCAELLATVVSDKVRCTDHGLWFATGITLKHFLSFAWGCFSAWCVLWSCLLQRCILGASTPQTSTYL